MRKLLVIALVAAAGLGLFAIFGNRQHLNLILISVDTLRPDHLACYGRSGIETPNIDRLAIEGVRFTDAMSAVPLTLPSHATMLTGLYPPSHGIRDNAFMALPEDITTLAEVLKEEGYSTHAVVGAFVLDSRYGLDQGFDYYDDDLSGGRRPLEFGYAEISADAVTDKVTAWLEGTRQPFFAFIHYYDPHTTYAPPEPYATIYAATPYDGEIAYTDQAIGRLIDFLDDAGLLDRTLIVLVSDHGEGLGQHDEPTHGVLVYESTLRVPLIVRPPEASDLRKTLVPGSTVASPVSLVDIFPSVLDMLGFGGKRTTDGTSFFKALGREPGEARIRYFESLYPRIAYRWSPLRGLCEGRRKYILAPEEELYDLAGDPEELHNLARDETETTRRMRDRLVALAGSLENRPAAPHTRPTEEEIRKLRALGYVGGGTAEVPAVLDTGGPDPKRIITEFSKYMGTGEDAYAAGDFAAALESFTKLVELDPHNPQARVFRARTLMNLGRIDEAAAEYLRVTEIDPTNSTPYFHLGNMAQDLGRLDDALTYYGKALDLTPGSPEALANIGSILFEKGLSDSAERVLGRALKHDPQNRIATLNLGLVYSARGARDEALKAFHKSIALDPGSVKAMVNIAAIYVSEGQVDSTIKYLEKARGVDPTSASVLANLGNAYRQKGLTAKAGACYEAALAADPTDVISLFGLAAVRAGQGKTEEARRLLTRLLAIQPDFAPARNALRALSAHEG
jgi:arylsulfatase A-like enzyme/Flp pilus assembly protein TadD